MIHYVLVGETYLMRDERDQILCGMNEVAIAFDEDGPDIVLLKHGKPQLVERWAREARAKYVAAGYHDMAAAIKVVVGKFPVDELNGILDCNARLGKLLKTARSAPNA